jgi:Outer membrane protein beta-barrel domain
MRPCTVAVALLLLGCAVPANAEWQIRPFVGFKLGTSTTFVDIDQAAGKKKLALGAAGALIGEVLGLEADFGRLDGFFESETGGKVLKSSVTTLTGNVTVAVPKHLTEYTLRPYFVGGAGVMFVRNDQISQASGFSRDMTTMDFGGGVTGFLTRRVGVNWDVRHFQTVRGQATVAGVSIAPEQLSFWRVNMALAIRY